MARPPLPFVRHRAVKQISAKYRACRHPGEKVRWHAIWLLARTDTPRVSSEVADIVGLSAVTVREILHRWNHHGPAGLRDRRHANGAKPKLTHRQREAVRAALRRRPPDGGIWTAPKLARYVRHRWAISVCAETAWRWLRDLGLSPQVPRPRHPQAADRPTRTRWKKTFADG
jgi:transposase